jgi:hypothetical protein
MSSDLSKLPLVRPCPFNWLRQTAVAFADSSRWLARIAPLCDRSHPEIRRALQLHGLVSPQVGYASSVDVALAEYFEMHPNRRASGRDAAQPTCGSVAGDRARSIKAGEALDVEVRAPFILGRAPSIEA